MLQNWDNPIIVVNDRSDDRQYNLIEVYVQDPTLEPNHDFMVMARPVEFDELIATSYVTTSPHCGQSIQFYSTEINRKYGKNFIGCPTTGIGMPEKKSMYQDPFVNPVAKGIISLTQDNVVSPDKISDQGFDQDWQEIFNV